MAGLNLVILGLVLTTVVSLAVNLVGAQVHHVVGGDRGWDPYADVASWSSDRVFRVGDKIWFTYPADEGGVVELESREEYEACNVDNPIRMYTGGLDSVSLDVEGLRYFVSTNTHSCKNGLKLPVEVLPHQHRQIPKVTEFNTPSSSFYSSPPPPPPSSPPPPPSSPPPPPPSSPPPPPPSPPPPYSSPPPPPSPPPPYPSPPPPPPPSPPPPSYPPPPPPSPPPPPPSSPPPPSPPPPSPPPPPPPSPPPPSPPPPPPPSPPPPYPSPPPPPPPPSGSASVQFWFTTTMFAFGMLWLVMS